MASVSTPSSPQTASGPSPPSRIIRAHILNRRHHDTSRTSALLCGWIVAVISDRWRLAENVTVSVCASVRLVLTVNPRFGTAEIRHTASSPNRTVALPPSDGTV